MYNRVKAMKNKDNYSSKSIFNFFIEFTIKLKYL